MPSGTFGSGENLHKPKLALGKYSANIIFGFNSLQRRLVFDFFFKIPFLSGGFVTLSEVQIVENENLWLKL